MKKSILNLKGAQELTENEQKSIKGLGTSGGGLPNGSVCTSVGNNGCASRKCELQDSGVAICVA